MKKLEVKDLKENFFEAIGKEWMLVTAGTKEKFNAICGSKSGRNIDKVKETGLKPVFTENGNVLFEQARLSLECKKLYADGIKPECFLDKESLEKWYGGAHGGFHKMYIVEIENIYSE